ncbi:MAG: MarR family transcriptional regulator [Pseudomonadota bacterium]
MLSFHASLPMMLNTALDGVMPVYRELFARYDLTETQWRVLRVLWESDTVSSIDLARQTLIPAPSLVGVLDRLTRKGLIERRRSDSDRRLVSVVATDAGKQLGDQVMPEVERIHAFIQSRVSQDEWRALQHTLETLSTATQAVSLASLLDEPETVITQEAV